MAGTDTSSKARAADEADILAMRKGKRSKKKLVVILAAVLLLGGGGAGAWFTVLAPEPPVETAEPQEVEPEPRKGPEQPTYVNLDPLFVPYRGANGYQHRIALMLALEVDRATGADATVKSQIPRIREAYLMALTDRPLPGTSDGSIEIVYVKNRLRAENLRLLGPGVINDVLIRDIQVVSG